MGGSVGKAVEDVGKAAADAVQGVGKAAVAVVEDVGKSVGKAIGKAVADVGKAVGALPNAVVKLLENFFKDPPSRPPDLRVASKEEGETAKVLMERARKELGIDCINHYNFVVSGQSGVGKSSFINGVRSIADNHPGGGAAPVGETECTQVVKSYPHPRAPHVVLWDLPGAGTKAHPAATYFSDKKLYAFDAILILTSDRFLQVDFDIIKAALQYDTPCAFVRTKCDESVKNISERCNIKTIEASKRLRADVEKSFRMGLQEMGLADSSNSVPLFFISNRAFTKQSAYWFYNEDAENWDKSLAAMDEGNLLMFLMDSAKRRAPIN